MVAEDLDSDPGGSDLRPDLERLLREARRLLESIDTIVDLTRAMPAPSGEQAGGQDAADMLVSDLLKTLRPDRERKAGETGRILVVDDNESNRDLLRRRLLQDGHTIVTAESGEAALAAVETEAFDLILLDLLMPGMNGIEVLENLKADERWRHTPVIMISGLSESDAVIRCIEAGAEDYLPKPFNPILLRARIDAGLERKRWRDRERDYLASLSAEKEKSEALLRNILPAPVVLRLNAGEGTIADRFEDASILFADIVGFTPTAASMSATQLVARLNRIFSAFDALAVDLGVEKIKTMGDGYMAAAGLPEPRPDHAGIMVEFALAMLKSLHDMNAAENSAALELRIGIHAGPVVAGVIGRHKFTYDVWGDTVNTASRLESQGVPGRIHVSESIQTALSETYLFEGRGNIALKGKGETRTFLVNIPERQRWKRFAEKTIVEVECPPGHNRTFASGSQARKA